MKNIVRDYEELVLETPEKLTLGEVLKNHPPAMNWYLGLSCLSFGFVYMFLYTML